MPVPILQAEMATPPELDNSPPSQSILYATAPNASCVLKIKTKLRLSITK